MREWRPKHPLMGVPRSKDSARSIANIYKKRGVIEQEPCTVCGSSDSEMHHPDHENPLEVSWLCRGCHLAWHRFWKVAVRSVYTTWASGARQGVFCETPAPAGNTVTPPTGAALEAAE
jgi:hypothetical protein